MGNKLLLLLFILLLVPDCLSQASGFDAYEKTIPELQQALERGETTSQQLVRQYLDRIAAFDTKGPVLKAMIYLNPRALEEAARLDRERKESGPRSHLHGIPVVLKDNYDTHDMPTSAGLLALAGFVPPDDGYQVKKLREAGAVFIGKTNMHELARGITNIGSLGGQTRNPYDPRRNPGGSSGGTGAAVAANFASVGMGSDTCGSIRIPAANNNLFGLRVTQGLSSRDGIIPLSHTQDVGGPLARHMIDLAIVLDATVGSDPADPQSSAAKSKVPESFAALADQSPLSGLRLGLLKSHLLETAPYAEMTEVVGQAVKLMTDQGAETVEVEIEGLDQLIEESRLIGMEVNADLAAYFERSNAPVGSVAEILGSGLYHAALEERLRNPIRNNESYDDYPKRLANREPLKRAITEAMEANKVDVLVYPTLRVKPGLVGEGQSGSSCQISAHSGLPAITLPAGFTPDGIPVGIELLGGPFQESLLVKIGFAYERVAKPRRAPSRTPSLVSDVLTYEFEIESTGTRGNLRLDRTTQTLHYDLDFDRVEDRDIVGIRLHRGKSGENGPVIELLGKERKGLVAIRNEDLDDLLDNGLYVVVYTAAAPRGAIRAQLVRRM